MPETSASKQSPVKAKRKSSLSGLTLSILAILLALVALALSIVIWHRLNAAQLEQTLTQFKVNLQQSQTQMQADIAANRKTITQLTQQIGSAPLQQTIVEAAYLIRLAHLHLMLENNPELSLQLLKMAQEQLQTISSSSIIPLKEAISHDITALSAVPQIDVTELFDRLEQLESEIASLSIQPRMIPQSKSAASPTTPAQKNWWDKIKYNLSSLKNLFVIRRVDHSTPPLLEPKQTLFLKENLQLKLIQAQWALLNQNPSLYQKSLNAAAQWLIDYNHDRPETAEIIKKIQALAVINIKPSIPSLQSLQTAKLLLTSQQEPLPATKTEDTEQ